MAENAQFFRSKQNRFRRQAMRRAAIVSPLRTAVGAFGGSLTPLKMEDLGNAILKALV